MRMSELFQAVTELGHEPKEVNFKCDKDRPAVLVVTLKKNGAVIGLYDTVTRGWI